MAKNLVIVESPAKADTIEGFLGEDFKVKSSNGHVRDLVGNDLSVDVDNNFSPTYEIMGDKKKIVDELNLPAMRLYHLSVVDFSAIREVVSFHPRVRLAEAGERIQI